MYGWAPLAEQAEAHRLDATGRAGAEAAQREQAPALAVLLPLGCVLPLLPPMRLLADTLMAALLQLQVPGAEPFMKYKRALLQVRVQYL